MASKPQTPRDAGGDVFVPEAPAWAILDGDVSISINEFHLEAGPIIEAIQLTAVVSEPKLMVEPISAQIGEGALKGSGTVLYAPMQAKPYTLSADIRFDTIDPAFFVQKHQTAPVQGQFDGVFQVTGAGESLDAAIEDSKATLKITGEDGILTAFEMDERQQLGLGLAGLLGKHLDRPGIAALSDTVPYFKEIPFDHFVFELTRGEDKRVLIPQLRLTGESVLLDASGSVGASELSEVLDQPLDLSVTLGARGRLTESLEVLGLLQPTVAEDGFRPWNKEIQVTGSLADPDTGALMDLLNDAAKGALSKSKRREPDSVASEPTSQSSSELVPQVEGTDSLNAEEVKPQSKEERRRGDIEMGLDLLNSFLGN